MFLTRQTPAELSAILRAFAQSEAQPHDGFIALCHDELPFRIGRVFWPCSADTPCGSYGLIPNAIFALGIDDQLAVKNGKKYRPAGTACAPR
jgi:hypothetical protein